MQLQAAVFSGVPSRFSARGRALLLQVYREIKPMSLFEAACKCHKQSSVKIRKGTLFLCSILPSTAQNSGSPGPQIAAKQDLRGDGGWQGRLVLPVRSVGEDTGWCPRAGHACCMDGVTHSSGHSRAQGSPPTGGTPVKLFRN